MSQIKQNKGQSNRDCETKSNRGKVERMYLNERSMLSGQSMLWNIIGDFRDFSCNRPLYITAIYMAL